MTDTTVSANFPKKSRPTTGPNQPLLFKRYRLSLPGLKRPGREIHHPSSFSAETKNERSCTFAPPIRLHDLHSDTFTFNFLLLKFFQSQIKIENKRRLHLLQALSTAQE
jgi:hypothetical protein